VTCVSRMLQFPAGIAVLRKQRQLTVLSSVQADSELDAVRHNARRVHTRAVDKCR
jgi:hypothetical protein